MDLHIHVCMDASSLLVVVIGMFRVASGPLPLSITIRDYMKYNVPHWETGPFEKIHFNQEEMWV